jgi:hypothetical protein
MYIGISYIISGSMKNFGKPKRLPGLQTSDVENNSTLILNQLNRHLCYNDKLLFQLNLKCDSLVAHAIL